MRTIGEMYSRARRLDESSRKAHEAELRAINGLRLGEARRMATRSRDLAVRAAWIREQADQRADRELFP